MSKSSFDRIFVTWPATSGMKLNFWKLSLWSETFVLNSLTYSKLKLCRCISKNPYRKRSWRIAVNGSDFGVSVLAIRTRKWYKLNKFLWISVPTGNRSIIKAVRVSGGYSSVQIIFKTLFIPLLKFGLRLRIIMHWERFFSWFCRFCRVN